MCFAFYEESCEVVRLWYSDSASHQSDEHRQGYGDGEAPGLEKHLLLPLSPDRWQQPSRPSGLPTH